MNYLTHSTVEGPPKTPRDTLSFGRDCWNVRDWPQGSQIPENCYHTHTITCALSTIPRMFSLPSCLKANIKLPSQSYCVRVCSLEIMPRRNEKTNSSKKEDRSVGDLNTKRGKLALDRRNAAGCDNRAHLEDYTLGRGEGTSFNNKFYIPGGRRAPQRGPRKCDTQHCSIARERLVHATRTHLARQSLFVKRGLQVSTRP